MKISQSDYVPDTTYFTMSDVAPNYDAELDVLTIYNGEGTRRSWGKPRVESTVVFRGRDLIAVHVGFSHKHRGSQGWHYFQREGDNWQKITWAKLGDNDRKKILDRENRAPAWAKTPGKLRKERRKPSTITAYKLVKFENERMISLFDPATEYELGVRMTEAVKPDHNGGYYAYPDKINLIREWDSRTLVPRKCSQNVAHLALIEVKLSGRMVEYGHKIAATHLTPVRIVQKIEVANV